METRSQGSIFISSAELVATCRECGKELNVPLAGPSTDIISVSEIRHRLLDLGWDIDLAFFALCPEHRVKPFDIKKRYKELEDERKEELKNTINKIGSPHGCFDCYDKRRCEKRFYSKFDKTECHSYKFDVHASSIDPLNIRFAGKWSR